MLSYFFFFTFQYNTAYSTHTIMKLWTSASLQTLLISPVHFTERTSLTFAPTVMKTNKEEINSLEVQGDTKRNGCFFSLPLADHLELTALFQRQSLLLSSLHLVFFSSTPPTRGFPPLFPHNSKPPRLQNIFFRALRREGYNKKVILCGKVVNKW